MNYAFDIPIDTVLTIEGKCVTDQTYYKKSSPTASLIWRPTWTYGIQLSRKTFVLPTPTSAMSISLLFIQTIIDGETDFLKFTGAPYKEDENSLDKRKNQLGLNLRQDLWYNQIGVSFKVLYNLSGSYLINPGFKYRYGEHWYFGLYGNFMGGHDKRAGGFGSIYWADDVYARITYQF